MSLEDKIIDTVIIVMAAATMIAVICTTFGRTHTERKKLKELETMEITSESNNWRTWLNAYQLGLYDKWQASHIYDTYTSKTTFVLVTLKNGFQITGTSHCEDPSKFSEQLGHKFALQDALDKLGQLDAFYSAQQKYEEHSKKVAPTFEPKDRHITYNEVTALVNSVMKEHLRLAHTTEQDHPTFAQMKEFIHKGIQDYDREARSRFKTHY